MICWRGRGRSAGLAGASDLELPFADGAFDAVHSADVPRHMAVAVAGEALAEFQRVLRLEGLVALRLRARRRFAPDVYFDHAYTERLLGGQLAAAGFEVTFLRRVNVRPSLAAELAHRLQPPARDDRASVMSIAGRG